MRYLLVILATIGLLLSPAAASAAALSCAHEHSAMEMAMASPGVDSEQAGSDHACCDEAAKTSDQSNKSAEHDATACAQACATMCAVSAALPVGSALALASPVAPKLEPTGSADVRAFAPQGLKRPPRSNA